MKLSSVFLMGLVLFSFFSCSKGDDEITEIPDKKEDVTNPSLIRNSECHAVDMGTSVLWAAGNLGADYETDQGFYYACCETTGYTKDGNNDFTREDKRTGTRSTLGSLEDAAHNSLGGTWRVPTYSEWEELIDVCAVEWSYDYKNTKMAGALLTSKRTGYSIFLPAAGYFYKTEMKNWGWKARYMTSFYDEAHFYCFDFDSRGSGLTNVDRYACGVTIRAVCKK